MLNKEFRISSEKGLNARLSSTLVKVANKYQADITIKFKNKNVNLKSIMGIMSLQLLYGDVFTLEVNGIDEEKAFSEIRESISNLKIGNEVE